MKVLVAVKRVLDANLRPRLRADGSGFDIADLKMAINPFDEVAVEEAVRLKERGVATEAVAVTIGPPKSQEVLRTALALGAQRAIHVQADDGLEPLAVAKALAEVVKREAPALVLVGKQAIDSDNGQVAPMLAALLGWPQADCVSSIEAADGGAWRVISEADDGTETWTLHGPCVMSADLRLNTPRYTTLPNIMKAKSKPLQSLPLAELGVQAAPRLQVRAVVPPPARSGGVRVKDVSELAGALKQLGLFA
ncbi:MAG: electron transfer flavoprotein subunit beta/FixA family protein [Rubrivivax sp.]